MSSAVLAVLVADPDPARGADLCAHLAALGHRATATASAQPGPGVFDVALVAAGAPAELTHLAKGAAPRWLCVVEPGDVEGAVRALRAGALDAFPRPTRASELRARLARLVPGAAAEPGSSALGREGALAALVGTSPAMQALREQVLCVAAAPRTTVLVSGESGAGKELVARAVHAASERSCAPFVAVNCASLGAGLFESELFGYEPGAYTGARAEGHQGLLASAEGGTLLLDEIGELDLSVQARLLRLLEERSYRRVGGSSDLRADVRIVAATHRDLARMVEEGTFREDLFYRLNVLALSVPSLADRLGDVPRLAEHFLRGIADELGRPGLSLAPATLARLCAHAWPGNVRELRNCIERAAVRAKGDELAPEHLGLDQPAAEGARSGSLAGLPREELDLRRMEERLVRRALELTGGNKSESARLLGVNRATLYNKLRALAPA